MGQEWDKGAEAPFLVHADLSLEIRPKGNLCPSGSLLGLTYTENPVFDVDIDPALLKLPKGRLHVPVELVGVFPQEAGKLCRWIVWEAVGKQQVP